MSLRTSMVEAHSSKGRVAGQGGAITWSLLLLALGIAVAGCASIYHKTRDRLPPEPAAELRLRLEEAARAELQTEQAAEKLARNLQRHGALTLLETDYDRLEAAAFDLERRTSAARDVVRRGCEPSQSAAELDRLSQKADAWLGFVRTNRAADPTTQLHELQRLLR